MKPHDARSRPSDRNEQIVGWCAVGIAAVLTFVALSSSGRPPGVDLPQHALFLQRMIDGDGSIYQVCWVVPYVLLFAIAMPFAAFSDPVQAIWTASALAVALLPVGAAAIASSLRRSPALGLFAYLTAFSTVVAWGFSSVVLGAGVFGLTVAAAIRYGRAPTTGSGLLLAAMIVLTYSAHSVAWTVAVAACWTIALLWPPRIRLVQLWPLVLGTGLSVALMNAWLLGLGRTWVQNYLTVAASREEHDLATRVIRLPFAVTEYGRPGALLLPWLALALLFVVAVGLSWVQRARVLARVRRGGSRCAGLPKAARARRILKRHGVLIALCASLVAYFVVPLWVGQTLMVYPRVMVLGVMLVPAVFAGGRSRAVHWLAVAALIPCVLMILGAARETRAFAEGTKCLDTLTRKVRPEERILSLYFAPALRGYSVPADLHLVAEIAARRRGMVGKDFIDYGYGPVTYRPGYDRLVVPANLGWNWRLYDHARHGREFTAWLLVGPRGDDVPKLLRGIFGANDALRAHVCGGWTLVLDTSAKPGSRPGEVFLPHRHAEGTCSPQLHAAALGPLPPAAEPR